MKKKILILTMVLSVICTSSLAEAKTISNIIYVKKQLKLYTGDKYSLKIKKGKYKNIKWKSYNTSIAAVSNKGVIKAKKKGKVKIVGSVKKCKFVYVITVHNKKEKSNNKKEMPSQNYQQQNNKVKETPTPESPVPIVTSTSEPVKPTAVPTDNTSIATPTPTTSTQKKSLVLQGPQLGFNIDQQNISKDTKVLSGKLLETTAASVIKVYVGGKISDDGMKVEGGTEIGKAECEIGTEEFIVDVDFSNIEKGTIVNVIRQPVPYVEPVIVSETDTLIVKEGVWSVSKQLQLEEKSTETEPVVAEDIWLLFGIKDDHLTKDTKEIICEYAMNTFPVCLEVNVSGKFNAKKEILQETDTIPIEVDFSNCEIGDTVEISLKYIGDEEAKGGANIWDQTHKYKLK